MGKLEPANPQLQFLKLGGSLITEKDKPRAARQEVIARLADEIQQALESIPDLQLVLGHGSGSFGHVVAKQHGTRQGVHSAAGWQGFAAVWQQARDLNLVVMEALHASGLAAIAFPASGCALTEHGRVVSWDIEPIKSALAAGILPVVYGDVVFDREIGGTILSTEDIFSYLAGMLIPARILLAGMESGVWADYPANTQLVPSITPQNYVDTLGAFGTVAGDDVTGGMKAKVKQMLDLVKSLPGLEAVIFSGEQEGNLDAALRGDPLGTRVLVSRG
jgi:isopentenyl phosphate kinase